MALAAIGKAIMSAFSQYFSSAGFIPHGFCLLWRPDVLILHVVSDAIIAASYFSIPLAIIAFVRRRRDLLAEHRRIAILFSVFILGCGLTHVFAIVVLWRPLYVEDGLIKAFTALASIATALALWPMLPRLLQIPSPSQLALANSQLRDEIEARRRAIDDLEHVRSGLEAEVRRRTTEMEALARRFEIATEDSLVTVCEQDASLRYTWLHNPRPPLTAEAIGRVDGEVLEPAAAAALAAPKRRVLATGEPISQMVVLPVAGVDYSFAVKITPAKTTSGETGLLVAAVDITEQKRQQAHLQVIMRELAHRAKNILSLVDGIARQTAKAEALPDTFVNRFGDRLSALGQAYDLLISEDWRGVDLRALVETQLAFILPEAKERVATLGPGVVVRPEVGQYLALALHELVTNATKYGALRQPGGRLTVEWRVVEDRAGAAAIELEWTEFGVAIGAPERSGFGRSLLERVVPRGLATSASLDFSPSGICWRIVFAQ